MKLVSWRGRVCGTLAMQPTLPTRPHVGKSATGTGPQPLRAPNRKDHGYGQLNAPITCKRIDFGDVLSLEARERCWRQPRKEAAEAQVPEHVPPHCSLTHFEAMLLNLNVDRVKRGRPDEIAQSLGIDQSSAARKAIVHRQLDTIRVQARPVQGVAGFKRVRAIQG